MIHISSALGVDFGRIRVRIRSLTPPNLDEWRSASSAMPIHPCHHHHHHHLAHRQHHSLLVMDLDSEIVQRGPTCLLLAIVTTLAIVRR